MIRSIVFDEGRVRVRLLDRTYRELRGDERARALAWLATRAAWLEAREPGVMLRSLRVKLDERRALITLAPLADEPPRALVLDGASFEDFVSDLGDFE